MSNRDEFDSSNGGEYVNVKDLLGELLLFTPTDHLKDVETVHGEKDAVITDLVVLSADSAEEHHEVMVFQGSLIGALKRKIPTGRKLLGVLALGEAKRGQHAPYVLNAPTEQQKQIARDYLAGKIVASATSTEDAEDDPFAVRK